MAQQENIRRQPDQQLLDLEPDEQKTILTRIFAPKVIILTFLSLIFISKNLYNYIMIPRQKVQISPEVINQADWKMVDKMSSYILLTIVLIILYFVMIRINNKAMQKKIRQQLQKEQMQKQKKE